MKSEYYLATIISQYRKVIDSIYNSKPIKYNEIINESLKAESRPASHGFYKGKITTKEQIFDKTRVQLFYSTNEENQDEILHL